MTGNAELLKKVIEILDGIDKEECDDESGWWETSTGAEFGKSKLREVISALQAMERKPEWLDIDSAPKDGTAILGYWPTTNPGCGHHAVKWFKQGWWEPNEDHKCSQPTHWMPLPAAPDVKGELSEQVPPKNKA